MTFFVLDMCSKPIYCALKIAQKDKKLLEVGSTAKSCSKVAEHNRNRPSRGRVLLAPRVEHAHHRDFFLHPQKLSPATQANDLVKTRLSESEVEDSEPITMLIPILLTTLSKSNIQIEIKRIRARLLASKLLHFVSLTDSFIMLDAKLLNLDL